MEKERLIEIVTSILNDRLCGGCRDTHSPYAYGSCKGGSCDLCRSKAAEEVVAIINAQPEQMKGTWIEVDDAYNRISGRCSNCGWDAHLYEDDVVGMPYCPNCGARMEGVND